MSEPILGPTVVRWHRHACVLKVTDEGVFITPETPSTECCPCTERNTDIALMRADVIGAERVPRLGYISHSVFRIYYAMLGQHGGPSQHTTYRLRATEDIDCGSGIAYTVVQTIQHWALNDTQNESERRVLFLINPKSGRGTALRVFQRRVRPVIRNVLGWKCTHHTTKHKGHATEILRGTDLSPFTMICILGGDGTIHEGLQGLLSRRDWTDWKNIPLVPFPLGTGNALAASIGIRSIDMALIALSKEKAQNMDILSVVQKQTTIYSFLGIMYGALSSIDIESENLRCLGDFRFALGAIRELIRMRSFKIKIAYLPIVEGQAATSSSRDVTSSSGGQLTSPSASRDVDEPQQTYSDVGAGETQRTGVIGQEIREWFAQSTEDGFGPDCWRIHNCFDTRLMAVLNLPFIAQTSHFMPPAGLSDGAMHLLLTPTKVSTRSQMLKLFLKSEKGQHLGLDSVMTTKIRAMIFSPEQNPSVLTVDGEVIASEPISVEVVPRLIKVISVPPLHLQDSH